MFRSNGEGIQKHKEQDHPVERDRFDSQTAFLPKKSVDALYMAAGVQKEEQKLLDSLAARTRMESQAVVILTQIWSWKAFLCEK